MSQQLQALARRRHQVLRAAASCGMHVVHQVAGLRRAKQVLLLRGQRLGAVDGEQRVALTSPYCR